MRRRCPACVSRIAGPPETRWKTAGSRRTRTQRPNRRERNGRSSSERFMKFPFFAKSGGANAFGPTISAGLLTFTMHGRNPCRSIDLSYCFLWTEIASARRDLICSKPTLECLRAERDSPCGGYAGRLSCERADCYR
jgi:hypothetical protein